MRTRRPFSTGSASLGLLLGLAGVDCGPSPEEIEHRNGVPHRCDDSDCPIESYQRRWTEAHANDRDDWRNRQRIALLNGNLDPSLADPQLLDDLRRELDLDFAGSNPAEPEPGPLP